MASIQTFLLNASRVTIALTVVAVGCAAPQMAVAPDIAHASEALPVVDRSIMSGALVDESFKLGPYKVANVDRKWSSTSSTSIGPYSSSDTTGGYTFALQTPGGSGEYKGSCASRKDTNEVSMVGGVLGQDRYEILCNCAGPTQASFTMKADTTSHFSGTFQTSQANYPLIGIYTNAKGSSAVDPLGYEVRGTEPLGAVETTGRGRVWVSRSAATPAREEIVCLFAGLLLYKAPQPDTRP
jgi:hypothetical protein